MVNVVDDPIQKIIDDVEGETQYERVQYRLKKYIAFSTKYEEQKNELENHKAYLKIATNWKDELPDIPRPTVADKEAWVQTECYDSIKEVTSLNVQKNLYKELFMLENLRYEKEDKMED